MHAIIPGCSSVDESKKGCVRKCQDNFSQGRRIKIHKHYWDLSKDLKNQWISYMVDTDTVEKGREKVQVCQKTFPNVDHISLLKG